MNNVIICKSCGAENPFYEGICNKCQSFTAERIINLDLWNTIAAIIETPVNAFSRIIRAKHKNFILLIFLLSAFKLFINSFFLSLLIFRNERFTNISLPAISFFIAGLLVLVLILSLLMVMIIKLGGIKTRFKDLTAVMIYALLPYACASIILFPVELIIFGQYLFSVNPSPYIIKPLIAWIMTSMELLVILWSIFLLSAGLFAQTKSLLFSIILSLLINFIFYIFIYSYSVLPQL
jgi:hypothetical protein